jgi:hypothetical protein
MYRRKLLEVESEEEEEEDDSQGSGSSETSSSEDDGAAPVSPPACRGGAAPSDGKASAGKGGPRPAAVERASPNENSTAKSPGKEVPASAGKKKRRILNWSDDEDEW